MSFRTLRDWGTATVRFQQPRVLHVFVLTLGFSRRGFYQTCPNETVPQFLDAHERGTRGYRVLSQARSGHRHLLD